MDNYLVYVAVAAATIILPGPAVMLTLNNAIQRGWLTSLAGIAGIALAILLVAIISATSVGIILASSAVAFTVVKMAGAAYLIYLGVKMWRTNTVVTLSISNHYHSGWKCFIQGFLVSSSNPKAIVFFMSVFPQFIDVSAAYVPQFLLLAVTFSGLVIAIHSGYVLFASLAKAKLSSAANSRRLNKISGGVFIGFGVGLAASSK